MYFCVENIRNYILKMNCESNAYGIKRDNMADLTFWLFEEQGNLPTRENGNYERTISGLFENY